MTGKFRAQRPGRMIAPLSIMGNNKDKAWGDLYLQRL